METNRLNYRGPQKPALSSASNIQIERSPAGGVIVRAVYPPGKFRDAIISTVFGVGAVVACCLFVFLWGFGRSKLGAKAMFLLFPLFPIVVVAPLLIRRVLGFAGTYLFEADADGITIHTSRGRREWTTRLPREQITDVRLGFGTVGGRHGSGRSTAWLIIALASPNRFNKRLLYGLGGDQLAHVADALRAGIGLPPRSWP
jgi:hypothetical protein